MPVPGRRPAAPRPPAAIGVIARTLDRANTLIRELGLADAAFAISSRAVDGLRANAILIDESALPLDNRLKATLLRNLAKSGCGGQLYLLQRMA